MSTTLWAIEGEDLCELRVLVEDDDVGDDMMLYEYRAAEPRDIPDFSRDVAEEIQAWLDEDELLAGENGAPCLHQIAFANAIRSALDAALAEHLDLRTAAWQSTGRSMTAGEARASL